MTEVWKDIKGYEGFYEVSNLGNVKSLNYNNTGKEKNLRPGLSKGYLKIQLYKDGKPKNHYIQQLVAEAFIQNPLKLPCVNHKDENKLNNCVDNLEWCSYSYNNTYNGIRKKAGKKSAIKLSIPIYCIELGKVFSSTREACRITGIYSSNITKCLKGRLKSAGGYHWEYA